MMNRFYFDFHDSEEPDDEGVQLGSLDEAVSLAASTMALMAGRANALPKTKGVTIRVGHCKVAVVALAIEVHRLV
ncbi:hypothetical protein [Aquibium sp. ELW1220]|uniref:DUF6894 family protein n=1 Tax=Aquibium sp. ELW1220 TaxID=2976766 RepID=UPI0025B07ACD|nr:hypothetical protein [Aquibium sp. ELW1220]MDN2578727.1 hypothetical protein [Aquibium sp. ELW1220]